MVTFSNNVVITEPFYCINLWLISIGIAVLYNKMNNIWIFLFESFF